MIGVAAAPGEIFNVTAEGGHDAPLRRRAGGDRRRRARHRRRARRRRWPTLPAGLRPPVRRPPPRHASIDKAQRAARLPASLGLRRRPRGRPTSGSGPRGGTTSTAPSATRCGGRAGTSTPRPSWRRSCDDRRPHRVGRPTDDSAVGVGRRRRCACRAAGLDDAPSAPGRDPARRRWPPSPRPRRRSDRRPHVASVGRRARQSRRDGNPLVAAALDTGGALRRRPVHGGAAPGAGRDAVDADEASRRGARGRACARCSSRSSTTSWCARTS